MKPLAPTYSLTWLWLALALLAAVALGWVVAAGGVLVPAALLAVPVGGAFVWWVFREPRMGVWAYVVYCFVVMTINRHVPSVPFGLGMEALLLLTWLAVAFHQRQVLRKALLRTDLWYLTLAWAALTLLELGNPAGASPVGWFYEARGTAIYWLLTVPLALGLLYRRRDLRTFLALVIGMSVVGALYGLKQKFIGVDGAEARWLAEGAGRTHLIFGRLRVFSIFSEAAQFGSSQAHIAVVSLVLALGPGSWLKRLVLLAAAGLLFYGMLISGTRGALFVVAVAVLVYLALSKRLVVLLLGGLVAGLAFGALKYTYIGNSNADVVRLRSSLNPNDPSLLVRLENQVKLRAYLANRPLGSGVGSTGTWGRTYNPHMYVANIPPDSYFVKIWVEYGIVGILIWLGIVGYILGKSCGIVWNIRDPLLRNQLTALTAGFAGIFFSSYGNEVINQMPSAMIVFISWSFIFQGPRLDRVALAGLPAPSSDADAPAYAHD